MLHLLPKIAPHAIIPVREVIKSWGLTLNRCYLGKSNSAVLSQLSLLIELQLDDTRITADDLMFVKAPPNLERLSMCGNPVDASLVDWLHTCHHLKVLDVTDTKLGSDDTCSLPQLLSGVEIFK
jgi:hypothetical protein